jgi:anti-sigma factor RsiW
VDCNAAWTVLESDRPVDAAALERASRHVERCPSCRARIERDALLAGQLERFRAPPELAVRIDAALDGVAHGAAVAERRTAWRRVAALAASFLIGAVLAGGYAMRLRGPDAQRDVITQAVSAHIGAQMGDRLTQVASADQHTVKPWFAGRLDIAPPVRDLSAHGFVLQGARLDYLDRRPIGVVVYQHRRHAIDVFVRPAAGSGSAAVRADRGYNTVSWASDSFEFIAVSDLNAGDLARFQALQVGR